VQLADGRRKGARRTFVEELLSTVPIETYDLETARAHADLLAHVRKAGRTRKAHDLLIAATARARSRTVVSSDPRGFEDLPGVELRALGTHG
jgi:tRNA(fMet)-specific endonuclease VapC